MNANPDTASTGSGPLKADAGTTSAGDHHYGRDAAVAGGVGGAAYEADKHHKHDKDLTQAERDAKREHKHELKEEKREHHKDHHYGKDAAVAGGVGGAAYEADKHHNHGHSGHSTTGNTTAGPHSSDLANKADPTVDSDRSKDHHYGRDTAVAGGVGGAAYEADKHHNHGHSGHSTTGNTTAGPHSSDLANKADPTVDSDRSKDHHYGRDAAVAGGVGGAAYEADKHHKHDKDLTQAERDAKREHKHELKEEKKEHKSSKGGLLSFLRKPLPTIYAHFSVPDE